MDKNKDLNNTTLNSYSTHKNDDAKDSILTLNFNQDGGCLAVGTTCGFRICNVFPYAETFRRNFGTRESHLHPNQDENDNPTSPSTSALSFGGGGIGNIEMLFRCNLLALVGGGSSPQYPPNKVLIWDDHLGRPIGELSFRQRVLNVKMRRDRICVALRDRVYVYNFANLSLLDTIITGGENNGLGLLSISTDASGIDGTSDEMILACPSTIRGQVHIELYGQRKKVLIDAHDGPLASIVLSADGTLLGTASERGTIIRLFYTGAKRNDTFPKSLLPSNSDSNFLSENLEGIPLREYRRGVEHAKITNISFSSDKMWLSCVSDRETVHVFRVWDDNPIENSGPISKSRTSLSYATGIAKKVLPSVLSKSPKKYLLEGQSSYAQVRGISRPQISTFVPDQPFTIAVAGLDDYGNGCLMHASFGDGRDGSLGSRSQNPVKGEAKRIAYHRFFKKGKYKKELDEIYVGDNQVYCTDDADINQVHKAMQDVMLESKKKVEPIPNATDGEDDGSRDTDVSKDEASFSDQKTHCDFSASQ